VAIKKFSQYLLEEQREVYFTFSKVNPPTIEHGKIMDTLAARSGKADYKIYVSQTCNESKDPLSYSDKIKHVRKMFPKHARNVIVDKTVTNPTSAMVSLYEQGYRKVTMVVAENRVHEFDVLLNKYNGKDGRHGFYNFKRINVVSASTQDPDATNRLRENAYDNDFVSFSQGIPKSVSNTDARKLFNDVRKGMGLSEETSFKRHLELMPVSITREEYVKGNLYELGDAVVVKESEEVGIISVLGANYVIVECSDGRKLRKWLDGVELVEKTRTPQDPDIKDKEGTQPKRYHAGLSKSTKKARDTHFKKGAEMDDNNPRAYKPAPGDKEAETKPSKYTKQFKSMFEEVTPKQISDLEKFADRLLAKFDIDVEFTRHFADRMNDSRNKPPITVAELQQLFKKIHKEKAKNIRKYPDSEVVLKDMQSDLNLPVVINYNRNRNEFEVVNKTIMRKKDFKTRNRVIRYTESCWDGYKQVGMKKKGGKMVPDCVPESTLEETPLPALDNIIKRLGPKTWQKKEYEAAKKALQGVLVRKGKGASHSPEYYAAQILRTSGLNLDAKVLAKMVAEAQAAMEQYDPVKQARQDIEREKEQDKQRHDRVLDRARLARARMKNRETK
jgi:hypothetical protein